MSSMQRIVEKHIPVVVATTTGLVCLAGYLLPNTLLSDYRDKLVEWAVMLAALALILGLLSVLKLHTRRVLSGEGGRLYSLVLIVAATISWVPALVGGPAGPLAQAMSDYVFTPLGASLAGLLVFTLTWSGIRLLQQRRSVFSVLFLVIVMVSLLGTTPLLGIERLSDARDWLITVPGMAGFRGLLLGVALGTLITGVRVLLAAERPHSES